MATHSRPRRASRTSALAVLSVATVLDYAVWLAWDQARDIHPVTGRETGPYEVWQVVGVGVVLALLAFVAGWWEHPGPAVLVIPAAFTACWVLDAATENRPDANLWPVGAALVAVVTVVATGVFAGAGWLARSASDRRRQLGM